MPEYLLLSLMAVRLGRKLPDGEFLCAPCEPIPSPTESDHNAKKP
jgi:hypothetical protein